MTHLRKDVLAAVRTVFPQADTNPIMTLLDEYGVQPYERELERVQLAIINLSGGDERKLRYFLAVAKQDYRDVLFWSEHPEEAKIDAPVEKKRVRERFEELGLKPLGCLSDTVR
jgi:hypothetical protein